MVSRRRLLGALTSLSVSLSSAKLAAADEQTVIINLFVAVSVAELDSEECTFTEPQKLLAVPSGALGALEYDVPDEGKPATIERSGVITSGCLFEIEINLPRNTGYTFQIGGTSVFMNYVILTRLGALTIVWEQPFGDSEAESSPDLGSVVTVGKWDVAVHLADIADALRGSIYDYRLLVTLEVTQLESGTHFVSQNVKLAVVTDTGAVIPEDKNASAKAQQLLGQTLVPQRVGDEREFMFVFNLPRDWEIPWERETIEGWKLHIEFRGDSVFLPLSILLPQ